MTITASIPQTDNQSENLSLGNQLQEKRLLNVALIDLYNGEANLGIQAIKDLVNLWSEQAAGVSLALHQFETRNLGDIPGTEFDIYISSGGPGSPFDGEGLPWEASYFDWIDKIWRHNQRASVANGDLAPKHVLFICHSFQMMCRHFKLGEVTKRRSQSFGVLKAFQSEAGKTDPLFENLQDPFYVADFRDWQVIQPNQAVFQELGATILAHEKIRPHVDLERAIMGIRLSKEMVGVQFHPEADPAGMLVHFQKTARRENIIKEHGENKFNQIISRLKDPEFLLHTYERVIPNFLQNAVSASQS